MLSKDSPLLPLEAKQQGKMNFLHCRQLTVPTKAAQVALIVTLLAPTLVGCGGILGSEVEAQPEQGRQDERPPSVEVAIAKTNALGERLSYTGNTEPVQEVSLRSQTEGRLLKLNVNIGDRVQSGQILAQLDDTLLQTALSQAEAELAARDSEVMRARNQVRNAQVRAEQAKVELQQAQADATRYLSLAKEGAVSKQQAELSQTEADVKRQALQSAQEQIRIEQEAVTTAEQRVKAQRSAVAQVRERRSYAFLTSPITGVVLERVTEPGNLIQPGGEVLKLGDFRQVKVVVPVSEISLGTIQVGQPVTVNLDAFPNQSFSGRVSRISPAANAATRQVPIEVTIPNPEGRIGSGLLARVEFGSQTAQRVVIPEMALQGENKDTVFILKETGNEPTVEARIVEVGDRKNDQIEIVSGLEPGEKFILRSSRPLKNNEPVRLSVLSES